MTVFQYIKRSISYYRKQNLALFVGAMISTAVLAGALIVGDSVRNSLTDLTRKRLGEIDHILDAGDRFLTADLGEKFQKHFHSTSLLKLNGLLRNPDTDLQIHKVEVLGIDSSFWSMNVLSIRNPGLNEMMVSQNVASRLKLELGDELLLRVKNVDAIPVQTPFAQDKEPGVSMRLKLVKILNQDEFSRFSLKSDQKSPFNIFVNKEKLQDVLDLEGKINLLLVSANNKSDKDTLDWHLRENCSLEDYGLLINQLDDQELIEISSERVFIDHQISNTVTSIISSDEIITYLVNGISTKTLTTPYSFISGVSNPEHYSDLKANEIIVNDWLASDLDLQIGDSIQLKYYTIGAYRSLQEDSTFFQVAGIEKTQGEIFHKELMPDFPGLSDANSCSEWETGVPIDLERIRDKDESYWDDFKGTPKALISFEKAVELWSNPYGASTAIRINDPGDLEGIGKMLLDNLEPSSLGLNFINVKEAGLVAANNSVDFSELFLSLSFFVIAAAVLLLVLVVSFNLLSRLKEISVLRSLGFNSKKILLVLSGEAFAMVATGALFGLLLGVAYNQLLLAGLNTIWHDAVRTHELQLHLKSGTLILAYFAGLVISFLTVFLVIRSQIRKSYIAVGKETLKRSTKGGYLFFIALFLLIFSIALPLSLILLGKTGNSSMFMLSGFVLLTALILFFSHWLRKKHNTKPQAIPGIAQLVSKNMSTNRVRSLLAVALLALGSFSVLITGANRRTFNETEGNRASASGGFLYWMESALPVSHDPDSDSGRSLYNLEGEELMDSIAFYPMLTLDGDDASCLNLNQVQNPRILGVDTDEFDSLGVFSVNLFDDKARKEKPWQTLDIRNGDDCIPAFIDQTVLTWGLMKSLGDTLYYVDEQGKQLAILMAGALNNTIFQGNILISDDFLRQHFPSVEGAHVLLVDGQQKDAEKIEELLSFSFSDFGVDFERTTQKLHEFNSVTNTYLNVFMLLGALGLLIGTLGFAIIILRNKQERKKEIAIMQAIGIGKKRINQVFLLEQLTLLLTGLLFGVFAAIVAILPSFISPAFSAPLGFIVLILLSILLFGFFWILLAILLPDRTTIHRVLSSE